MSRVDGLKCNVQGMTGRVMEQGFDVQGLRVKGQVVRGEFDGHAVHLCVLVKPRPKHVPPDHFVWGSSHRCLSRSWGSFLFPSAARLFFFI